MLCNFHDTAFSAVVYFKRIFDKRKVIIFKFNVYYRSHNLHDFSCFHSAFTSPSYFFFFFFCAFAPPITSVICWVIAA